MVNKLNSRKDELVRLEKALEEVQSKLAIAGENMTALIACADYYGNVKNWVAKGNSAYDSRETISQKDVENMNTNVNPVYRGGAMARRTLAQISDRCKNG